MRRSKELHQGFSWYHRLHIHQSHLLNPQKRIFLLKRPEMLWLICSCEQLGHHVLNIRTTATGWESPLPWMIEQYIKSPHNCYWCTFYTHGATQAAQTPSRTPKVQQDAKQSILDTLGDDVYTAMTDFCDWVPDWADKTQVRHLTHFWASSTLELIEMSILGLLPRTCLGNQYVVLMTDSYSKLTGELET